MQFHKTDLDGAYLIDLDKKEDERGFFSRLFCSQEFEKENLEKNFVQMNNSHSRFKGTLRGIHYQLTPRAETKLVRCIKGSIFDVVVDLRPNSKTFLKWFGEELNAENRRMMYVPQGFGHAFLTLEDDTEVLYMVSEYYCPKLERGIRWNDPAISIVWPIPPKILSDKDSHHPDFISA